MSAKMWHEVELWDSDGCKPDAEHLVKCMREFRAHASIQDYWFVDMTDIDGMETPNDDETRFWDPWNDEYRDSWDCGPGRDDIDWTGIDEACPSNNDDEELPWWMEG